MKRITVRLLVGAALIVAGWSYGRAQASVPTFELRIDAPPGQTNVTCLRGCELAWIERSVPGTAGAQGQRTFTYRCGGLAADQRCDSGRIGGWVTP